MQTVENVIVCLLQMLYEQRLVLDEFTYAFKLGTSRQFFIDGLWERQILGLNADSFQNAGEAYLSYSEV